MASTSFQPALVLPTPLNPAAKRVEIDEFIVDNVMTNLFLLALREMHDEKIKKASDPAEDWFSYYDVSGKQFLVFQPTITERSSNPRLSR